MYFCYKIYYHTHSLFIGLFSILASTHTLEFKSTSIGKGGATSILLIIGSQMPNMVAATK